MTGLRSIVIIADNPNSKICDVRKTSTLHNGKNKYIPKADNIAKSDEISF